MPSVIVVMGFRLFFYSNENNEPVHAHVEKAEGIAKWWLKPKPEEVYSYGFTARQRRQVSKIVEENKEKIPSV